jgi:two-component system sensor histidine kinase/response regulator
MLRKYLESQATIPAEFRHALANNDMATAERLAHTAKAVNGNIGATSLQHQAGELEQLCHSGAALELIEKKLALFEPALYRVITNIEAALPAKAEVKVAAYDLHLVKPVVEKLVVLLAADDSEACEFFEENTDLIRSVFETPIFVRMEKGIKNFDFDKALSIIKEHVIFSAIDAGKDGSANRSAP